MECEEASERIAPGDEITVDFNTGEIKNVTKRESYQAQPFPDFIKEIISAGGLLISIKRGMK